MMMMMKVKFFFVQAAFVCSVNDAQNMNANGEVRPPVCSILTDVDFNDGLASALNVVLQIDVI
jgi:hypothetical protein